MKANLDNQSQLWMCKFEGWALDCANDQAEFGNRPTEMARALDFDNSQFQFRRIISQMNVGYVLKQELTTLRARPELSSSLEPYVERLEIVMNLLRFRLTALVDRESWLNGEWRQ